MKGLFLQPRNSEEERHNWRLVSDSVTLTDGRLGGQTVRGGTVSGEHLTLKSNPSADGEIKLDLATEDAGIVDAGSTGATEQDWIEVKVGGVTGYIRVYATK